MSRIYFHSPSGEAEVSGAERAQMTGLCRDMFSGLFKSRVHEVLLRDMLPENHYALKGTGRDFDLMAELALRVSDLTLSYGGKLLDVFQLQLNTALALGNDSMKLAARLDGQCELHAWVRGENRAWFADLIDGALTDGVLREHLGLDGDPNRHGDRCGWRAVQTFLRECDDEPVVTSYSVGERFPNSSVAGWTPPQGDDGEENWDVWYDLPAEDRWRLAMAGLERRDIELKPDDWNKTLFGHGVHALTLPQVYERLKESQNV